MLVRIWRKGNEAYVVLADGVLHGYATAPTGSWDAAKYAMLIAQPILSEGDAPYVSNLIETVDQEQIELSDSQVGILMDAAVRYALDEYYNNKEAIDNLEEDWHRDYLISQFLLSPSLME